MMPIKFIIDRAPESKYSFQAYLNDLADFSKLKLSLKESFSEKRIKIEIMKNIINGKSIKPAKNQPSSCLIP
jgi:hypothetical protein